MKNRLPIAIILAVVVAACTSSQFATYHPAGSTEANWEINVLHKSGVSHNFKIVINDSTVVDSDTDFFGNVEAKGDYRGRSVKLMVTHSSGFLGIGEKYTAIVFISNELAGKFEF